MRSASSPVGAIRAPCPTPATPYRIERRMESSTNKSRERRSRDRRELSSVEIMAITEKETFEGIGDISGKKYRVEKQQKKRKGQNNRGALFVLKLPSVTMVSDDTTRPFMMTKHDGMEETERPSLPYVHHTEVKGNNSTPKVPKPMQTFVLPDLEDSKNIDISQFGLFGDGKNRARVLGPEKETEQKKTQAGGKIKLWKEGKKKNDTKQTEKKSTNKEKWKWTPNGRVFPKIERSVTVELNGRLSRMNMEETSSQMEAKASLTRKGAAKIQLSTEKSFESVTLKSRKSSTKSQSEDTGSKVSSGGSSPRLVLPELPVKNGGEKMHEIERKTKKSRKKTTDNSRSSEDDGYSVIFRTSENGLSVDAKHIMPLPKVTVPPTKMASHGDRKTSDKATEYEEPSYIAKLRRREQRRKELYDLLRYLPPLSTVSRTYAVKVISLGIDKHNKTGSGSEGSEVNDSPEGSPRLPRCACAHHNGVHPEGDVSENVSPRSHRDNKIAGDKMADPVKTRQTVSRKTAKRTREEEVSKRRALGMFRTIQLFENRKKGPVDRRYRNIYRLDPRYLNKRASREKGG